MSVHVTLAAIALTGTVFVAGCGQAASPMAPSASSSSISSATVRVTSIGTVATVLAQLNLVDNHLVSANQQLDLCVSPAHPPGPCYENSSDFYLKANAALDGVAVSIPPGPPAAPATDALNAIIEQANLTLGVLGGVPPGPPGIPQIVTQAQHTISVATALLSNTCNADQCS